MKITLIYPNDSEVQFVWYCVPRIGEEVHVGDNKWIVTRVVHQIEKSFLATINVYVDAKLQNPIP